MATLRVPTIKSWDDPVYLNKPPFQDGFMAFRAEETGVGRGKKGALKQLETFDGLFKEFEKKYSFRPVQDWLRHALMPTITPTKARHTGKPHPLSRENKFFFVKFYYILSYDRQQALRYLNDERRKRRLSFCIRDARTEHPSEASNRRAAALKNLSFRKNATAVKVEGNLTQLSLPQLSDKLEPRPQVVDDFAIKKAKALSSMDTSATGQESRKRRGRGGASSASARAVTVKVKRAAQAERAFNQPEPLSAKDTQTRSKPLTRGSKRISELEALSLPAAKRVKVEATDAVPPSNHRRKNTAAPSSPPPAAKRLKLEAKRRSKRTLELETSSPPAAKRLKVEVTADAVPLSHHRGKNTSTPLLVVKRLKIEATANAVSPSCQARNIAPAPSAPLSGSTTEKQRKKKSKPLTTSSNNFQEPASPPTGRPLGEDRLTAKPPSIISPPEVICMTVGPASATPHNPGIDGLGLKVEISPPPLLPGTVSTTPPPSSPPSLPALAATSWIDEDLLSVDPLLLELPLSEEEDSKNIPAKQEPPLYRPPLPRFPKLWAQSRQELCESFEWFRSYQGGVYHTHGVAYGYLLSAFASKRDCFEHGGKLIISHGGGKAESIHCQKGQLSTEAASDQLANDRSVRALIATYHRQRPLALVIDDKYVKFPYDLGSKDVTYAVLGFYTISDYWTEYQAANNEDGKVVRYKFAFRWCDGQGEPWWHFKPDAAPAVPVLSLPVNASIEGVSSSRTPYATPRKRKRGEQKCMNELIKMLSQVTLDEKPCFTQNQRVYRDCPRCRTTSPQVYSQTWVCLHSACTVFWKDPRTGESLPDELDYHTGFISLPPSDPLPEGFPNLEPSPPSSSPTDGIVTSRMYTRGWHCKGCGRLSCRFQWENWVCMSCEQTTKVQGKLHLAQEFPSVDLLGGQREWLIQDFSEIVAFPPTYFSASDGAASARSFLLPENRGMIHLIRGGKGVSSKEPDDIFTEYQEQAAAGSLKFRRWPLRAHKCRGPLLTHYFSQNSGEPYQYVGGAANTVPFSEAPTAVNHARAFIQKRIKEALKRDTSFNEVLSAAYMERQRMAFHSDNEIGLGPVVAGLSLGAPALMHFRLHSRFDPEKTQRKIAASFVLRHGDVLVMDGAGVQEFYEHTVIPNNFRIAATARQINANHK